MTKLKPCPFCGGEAYFDKDDHGWQWIECGKCHVATSQRASLMEDCKPLLAEAWNTRSAIDPEAIRRAQRMKSLLQSISSWFACWGIATKDDLGQSVEEFDREITAILSAEPAQEGS